MGDTKPPGYTFELVKTGAGVGFENSIKRYEQQIIADAMGGGFNPRYVAYAASHGRTPQEQLAADRQEYPGGAMAGFMIWIPDQWRRWAAESGEMKRSGWDSRQHAAFDAWLRATITTKEG